LAFSFKIKVPSEKIEPWDLEKNTTKFEKNWTNIMACTQSFKLRYEITKNHINSRISKSTTPSKTSPKKKLQKKFFKILISFYSISQYQTKKYKKFKIYKK
jgi:hypothetical protein